MLSVVPSPVTVRAPAKVNLHLAVGDLRDDGYHDINTVFQALSLADQVTVRAADTLTIDVSGEGAASVPVDGRNLVWKAATLLAKEARRAPRVRISIAKNIPVAGGMAGGSADAAAALVALNAFWNLHFDRATLFDLAAELGSDVPFVLRGGTAIGLGRGEKLLPVLSRNTFHWVLAFAKGGLSIPAVFKELDRLRENNSVPRLGGSEDLMHALTLGDPRGLAPLLGNDLEAAAVSLMPQLRRTLRAGVDAGALAGIVSGSGPTCAFLCADGDDAVSVAVELAAMGACRAVRTATGPAPGARVVDTEPGAR